MPELDQNVSSPDADKPRRDSLHLDTLEIMAANSGLLSGALPQRPSDLYRELCAPKLKELLGDRAAITWEATPEWEAFKNGLATGGVTGRGHTIVAGVDRLFEVIPETDPLFQALRRLEDFGAPEESTVMVMVLDAVCALEAAYATAKNLRAPRTEAEPPAEPMSFEAMTGEGMKSELLRSHDRYTFRPSFRYDDLAFHALAPALDALGRPWAAMPDWDAFDSAKFSLSFWQQTPRAIIQRGVSRFFETVDPSDPRRQAAAQIAAYLGIRVETVICASVLEDVCKQIDQRDVRGIRKALDLRDFVPADPAPAS